MPIVLRIITLDGPLCSVIGETEWTVQRLKEAIEEQTQFSTWCYQQQLVLGDVLLADSDILGDRCSAGEEITLVKRSTKRVFPNDARTVDDSRNLASLLRNPLTESPVILDLADHRCLFDLCHESRGELAFEHMPWEADVPRGDIAFEHMPWQVDELLSWLPWEAMFDIKPDEIAAVLALQSAFSVDRGQVCGGFVAGVILLKRGHLLAVTATIANERDDLPREGIICSAACPASSWEELEHKLPAFTQKLLEPPTVQNADYDLGLPPHRPRFPRIGPLRVFLGECLPRGGSQLQVWLDRAGRPQGFEPRVRLEWPLEGFCDSFEWPHPMGDRVLENLFQTPQSLMLKWWQACRLTEKHVSQERKGAIVVAINAAKGHGKGKRVLLEGLHELHDFEDFRKHVEDVNALNLPSCKMPFAYAVGHLRSEIANRVTETEIKFFDDVIEDLLASAPGDSRSYNFHSLCDRALGPAFVRHVMFGRGVSAMTYR